jgi:hypothetical protein
MPRFDQNTLLLSVLQVITFKNRPAISRYMSQKLRHSNVIRRNKQNSVALSPQANYTD